MMKKVFIVIIVFVLILLSLGLIFKQNIAEFYTEKILMKEYEEKYSKVKSIDCEIEYNKNENKVLENEIELGDLNASIINFNISEENKMEIDLKFTGKEQLNAVGYILRVYNDKYHLGDRYDGNVSITGADNVMYSEVFYSKVFDEYSFEKNLLNITSFSSQKELLDSGEVIYKLIYELPEEFLVQDKLNINLFDINYQYIGNKEFYKVAEPLCELNYTINIK